MNLDLILVFFIGMIPPALSLWMMRKVEIQCQQRQEQLLQAHRRRPLRSPRERLLADLPTDSSRTIELSATIGDTTCQYNARSPYLRCAINPMGPCEQCCHYEASGPSPRFDEPKS
ncbi:DUF6464 family protein [Roseofilum casamattae]|uniref:DUF6464 family protein n=1 Tax=Roseofilum casamattae BLCC-M143 TaxID=3022442 RepID=A0ABT7BYB7_9CYAN|nr:DUF6464 family protein [Roseofilum casamattae]MDJ1184196.1 DUF6464 family protein [Roseofilum casamattae BLCC-M143]